MRSPFNIKVSQLSGLSPLKQEEIKEDSYTHIPMDSLIARQQFTESRFKSDAVSDAGAISVAQITKDTFDDGLKKGYVPKGTKYKDLAKDDKLATQFQENYMQDLLTRGWNKLGVKSANEKVQRAKALAAYNMGPTRLVDILNEMKADGINIFDNIDWVDRLPEYHRSRKTNEPIYESKHYVKNVMLGGDEDYEREFGQEFENFGGSSLRKSGLSPLKQDWLASTTKTLRKNLAENLNPYGYWDPIQRIYKAGIKGEKSIDRIDTELGADPSTIDSYKGPGPWDESGGYYYDEEVAYDKFTTETAGNEERERIDLLNIVMGQPQEYNSIQESEYKPTKSKDSKATYYKSKQTEQEIKYSFGTILRRNNYNVDVALNKIIKGSEPDKDVDRRGGVFGSVLGKYKLDKGVDDRGHYISYYDIWDLNPMPRTGSDFIDTGVGKVAGYLTKKAGFKSPEIYGRIYYDPDTGEILDKED